jgi:dihydrofolate reductase
MDRNRLIGRGNALPWHLPADLKYFKSVTMGKPIIMGRKTFESIGKALPGRRNIIISRNINFDAPGCDVYTSLDAALAAVRDADEAVIIGGMGIYQLVMPQVQKMYLTIIDAEFEGDAWFPEYDPAEWSVDAEEKQRHEDGENKFDYRFLVLNRLSAD